ncbi:hypothetical protein M0R88_02150 [Halorussus gelatinilyticus]|uniref:DUF7827 domain-containing protein n=1 Tax=Halorussus gelatinilyticus TaxID=2937524 RepID=A0A8U0IIJ1_9EURY|nr:BGTF surface domain-containing protein [Halorussus gelatinilyticus]UPW00917.1 hypothetical protein M0R88_02150 [Halorussus gelatinilyticus]
MKVRYRPLILAALVLVSTTAPVLGASPDAEFGQSVVETATGETAEIPVTFSDTDAATVRIGSEAVNYIATVTLRDGNGDGKVVLRYDTAKAGSGGAFAVAADADSVSVSNETDLGEQNGLDPGNYKLAVAPGNASLDEKSDVATLSLSGSETTDPDAGTETTASSQYAGHVADIDNGVVVAPAVNQTITGQLDLDPGTEILVTAKGTKGVQFLKTQRTTVTEDGRFRASFDFSGLPSEGQNETEFQIEIRANDEVQREATGVVRSPPTAETTKQAVRDETTTVTTTQDGSIPGFSLVTGLLALVGVALVAARRAA